MMDANPFWIIIIVSYASLGLLFFFVGLITNLVSKKYSYLRHFPEEILSKENKAMIPLRILEFAFMIPSSLPIVFVFVYRQYFSNNLLVLEAIMSAMLLMMALLHIVLSFIPSKNTKPHFIISTIHFSYTFLLSAMVSFNGFYFMSLYNNQSTGSVYHLILGIVGALLVISALIVMFNPKITTWYKLESHENEDGSISVKRPKVFILAFSEWLMMLISFLASIIFIFELVKI